VPISSSRSWSSPRQFQNSVFTIISSQEGPSQKTQTSLKQTSPSQGQRSMSSTGTSHILYIRTSMNNNPSSQKLQCFKTSVSHQMIHCLSIMTQRQSNYHISQLTTSTICNYTFYIILNQSHSPPHQTCNSTNPQQNYTCIHTTFPNPISTCNQKDSSSNLCSSMNLCRYRGRQIIIIYKAYIIGLYHTTC